LSSDSSNKKEKWLVEASADSSLSDVVRLALDQRLVRLEGLLTKVVAAADPDPDDVHQLRVSSRRATAVFDLFTKSIPRRQRKRWKRRLRQIRRDATEARELDVLQHQLRAETSNEPMHEHVEQRRVAARAVLLQRAKATSPERLVRRREKLLEKCGRKSPSQHITLAEAAHKLLRRAAKPFFRAARGPWSDLEDLHRFRIAGKKLRYAMELLAAAFDSAFRAELYPQIEKLQDSLGHINDLAQAADRFELWSSEPADPVMIEQLRGLSEQRRQALNSARAQFEQKWNAERFEGLKAQFDRYAGAAAESRASN
jgi:CHAD domain-containing protein